MLQPRLFAGLALAAAIAGTTVLAQAPKSAPEIGRAHV